mgnify:CR=1 FL=1
MAITQAGAVGTGNTTMYTSTNTTAMFFMNDNATARTLNIFVVQSGASPATTNQIIKAVSIDGGDTYVINLEKLVLDNGDTIVATASAGSSIYGTISSVPI